MPRTSSSAPLLRVATLAALGLAIVLPLILTQAARAQTLFLNSGDAVTVDGTGTYGTTNNATTTYDDTTSSGTSAVTASGTAAFTLGSGGALTDTKGGTGLYAQGSGPILVTGGTITAGAHGDALISNGGSPVTISGGVITGGTGGFGVYASGTGTMTITGGVISAAGAQNLGLVTFGGVINLFSQGDTPFLVNNVPMNNTSLPVGLTGSISGLLVNGDSLGTNFQNFGAINLNPGVAPEPSPWAALGLGALGLAGLGWKARRRTA